MIVRRLRRSAFVAVVVAIAVAIAVAGAGFGKQQLDLLVPAIQLFHEKPAIFGYLFLEHLPFCGPFCPHFL